MHWWRGLLEDLLVPCSLVHELSSIGVVDLLASNTL